MGLFVVLLCIVGAIVAQQTRHQSFGTTEGRLQCLEDMYMRLQNEDARMKQQLAEKDAKIEAAKARIEDIETKHDARIAELEAEMERKDEVAQTRLEELQGEIESNNEDAQARTQELEEELKTNNEALRDRIAELEGDAVAFTAYATSSRTYNRDDIIRFDRIITNVGNHYSVATNKFLCPRRGLYLFSLVLYQPYDAVHNIEGAIMLDGTNIGEAMAWSDDDDESGNEGDQSSITTTVVCEANQSVWVASDISDGRELGGHPHGPFTMFTGVLIQPM